jgi:hypothetical protein
MPASLIEHSSCEDTTSSDREVCNSDTLLQARACREVPFSSVRLGACGFESHSDPSILIAIAFPCKLLILNRVT